MKISRLIFIILLLASAAIYPQADKSGYDQALEWYNKKHYVKAVDILKDYITAYPYDQRAQELLEKMYDKYTEFLKVYLAGKDFYNKKYYLKTIETFSNALEIGFSDKLQFYLTECTRTVFELENSFPPSTISDNGSSITVRWESSILTNAFVAFIRSENIPLLNMIYTLNRNKFPLPHLEKYFTQGNIFKSLSVEGNSFTFSKDQPADTYIVMIYPRTFEDLRSQPVVHLIISKPPVIENEYMLMELARDIPILPVMTNIHIITPGAPINSNTNLLQPLVKLTNAYTNLTGILISNIAGMTNLTNGGGTNGGTAFGNNGISDRGWIFPWWWFLLLLLLILLWIYMRERKKKQQRELMEKWRKELLEAESKTVKKPAPKKKRSAPLKPRKGKKLPLILLLIAGSIIFASAQEGIETADWRSYTKASLEPEIWNYYLKNYQITNLPQSHYDDIMKFYTFDKSDSLPPQYSKAIELLKDTSSYIRRICDIYFQNFDFENYALASFMVYFIDKDYTFFSASISELKKGKSEAIADKILQKSTEFEEKGLYLGALLRLTGYMSISPNITPDLFERINTLNKKYLKEITQYEYISAIKRIHLIIGNPEINVVIKNILCLRELFDYEARFAPVPEFGEMKKKIIELLKINYRILLFNGLIDEGKKAYLSAKPAVSKQCFELAWHISPKKELLPGIEKCIQKSKDAITGKNVIELYITNVILQ